MGSPDGGTEGGRETDPDQSGVAQAVRSTAVRVTRSVVGTLFLVGIAVFVVYAGGTVVLTGGGTPASLLIGSGMVGFGVYLGLRALRAIPGRPSWI